MSRIEGQHRSETVTPRVVFTKANEILDTYGQSGIEATSIIIKAPWRAAGFLSRPGPDVDTVQAPVVPIERDGNEYRLWLQRRSDSPRNGQEGAVRLSAYLQQLPYGLDRIEQDEEGRVTGYWYKPHDREELQYVQRIRPRLDNLPRELDFSWFLARSYEITPEEVKKKFPKQVPTREDVGKGLRDENDFLLEMLVEMQEKLGTQSQEQAIPNSL